MFLYAELFYRTGYYLVEGDGQDQHYLILGDTPSYFSCAVDLAAHTMIVNSGADYPYASSGDIYSQSDCGTAYVVDDVAETTQGLTYQCLD